MLYFVRGLIMNISQEEARASLSTVRDIMNQTRRAIASAYANPLLILWGVLWIIAFTAAHFYLTYAFHIFMTMAAIGGAGTAVIFRIFHTKAPIQEASGPKLGWRIAAFWILLYVYVIIWLFLLTPFNGLQCNAVISTAAMFGYVVIGLWFDSRFMIALGLVVTFATLAGFYLLTSYYCLWMALIGGGALLGTGLYIRLRWR
jgi:hypothetical protein